MFLGLLTPSGTEPRPAGYRRIDIGAIDFRLARSCDGGNIFVNVQPIEFPLAESRWGEISHFAIYNDAVIGEPWHIAAMSARRLIRAGVQASFSSGDLQLVMCDAVSESKQA